VKRSGNGLNQGSPKSGHTFGGIIGGDTLLGEF